MKQAQSEAEENGQRGGGEEINRQWGRIGIILFVCLEMRSEKWETFRQKRCEPRRKHAAHKEHKLVAWPHAVLINFTVTNSCPIRVMMQSLTDRVQRKKKSISKRISININSMSRSPQWMITSRMISISHKARSITIVLLWLNPLSASAGIHTSGDECDSTLKTSSVCVDEEHIENKNILRILLFASVAPIDPVCDECVHFVLPQSPFSHHLCLIGFMMDVFHRSSVHDEFLIMHLCCHYTASDVDPFADLTSTIQVTVLMHLETQINKSPETF